jgi:hypothetical protein
MQVFQLVLESSDLFCSGHPQGMAFSLLPSLRILSPSAIGIERMPAGDWRPMAVHCEEYHFLFQLLRERCPGLAGEYIAECDERSQTGLPVSGVYFIKLTAKGVALDDKIIELR